MGCGVSKVIQSQEIDNKHKGISKSKSLTGNGLPRWSASNGKARVAPSEEEVNEGDEIVLTTKDEVDAVLAALAPGELYCDPHFPAEDSSLFFKPGKPSNIVWLRPREIVREDEVPLLQVDGSTRDDIQQGRLGDCWFLSSCASVSQQERFLSKILPPQPLDGEGYQGVFHCCFWRFGKWQDVYIDDRLPTEGGKLIYGHCTEHNEFWVALLEKAYAKLHGTYEALEGGQTMNALVDLTGGQAERYELVDYDPNMYRRIMRAHKGGAFIACSKQGNWRESNMAEANGLVSGHAYTITGITKIEHERGEEKLLRIRNPWGDATEWKGSWSDNDVNWTWVDDSVKKELGVEEEGRDDGEFWMSFKDFCHHFQEVTICFNESDTDVGGKTQGHVQTIFGAWEKDTAGGSRNNLPRFATNPQYCLTLTQPDEYNPLTDDPDSEGKCSVLISLMQIHKGIRRSVPLKYFQIGFMVYKAVSPTERLPLSHFRFKPDCGKSGNYINFREVSGRLELDPGHYIIIPSTFHMNQEASFMLRVHSENPFQLSGPLEDNVEGKSKSTALVQNGV